MDADRGPARRAREREAALRPERLQAQGPLDPGEDQEGPEGMAADKGKGRVRLDQRRRVPRGLGAVGLDGRGAEGGEGPRGADSQGVGEAQGAAAPADRQGRSPMLAETREQPFSKA